MDAEAIDSEVQALRREVAFLSDRIADVTDIARATLAALYSGDRVAQNTAIFAARINYRKMRCDCRGMELRELIGHDRAHLMEKRFNVYTVSHLWQLRRSDVARLEGFGPRTMERLDAAIAEHRGCIPGEPAWKREIRIGTGFERRVAAR